MPGKKETLIGWIADDRLNEVFAHLLADCQAKDYRRLYAGIAEQSGEYRRVEKQYLGNLISAETYGIERAKLRRSLLESVNELPDDWPESAPASGLHKSRNRWKKWAAAIAAAIGLLAAVAELSGYSLRDIFWRKTEAAAAAADTLPSGTAPDTLPVGTTPQPTPQNAAPVQVERRPPVQEQDAPTATALTLAIKTDRGAQNLLYREGEILRLYVKAGAPCHLRLIYRLADGQLILLTDDRALSAAEAGRWVEIGAGFEVSAPLGEETLYAFAQDTPFAPLQTREQDGYRIIASGLPEVMRITRGLKPKTLRVETALSINTIPNS